MTPQESLYQWESVQPDGFLRHPEPVPPEDMEKLTDREVDVLMVITGTQEQPVPTGYILRNIRQKRRNSLQTLQVVLRRLEEKNVVSKQKMAHSNSYTSLYDRNTYRVFAVDNLAAHLFHGSRSALILFMIQWMDIGAAQLAEVRDIISELLQNTIVYPPEQDPAPEKSEEPPR